MDLRRRIQPANNATTIIKATTPSTIPTINPVLESFPPFLFPETFVGKALLTPPQGWVIVTVIGPPSFGGLEFWTGWGSVLICCLGVVFFPIDGGEWMIGGGLDDGLVVRALVVVVETMVDSKKLTHML